MDPIKLHTPQPTTQLPRHEQAARRHRAATGLPNFLTPTKPRTRRPTPVSTGRKTAHVDHPLLPSSHPHHP